MTTTSSDPFHAWWSTEHDHSRRCWWNWEVGRWVCPPRVSSAAAVAAAPSTSPAGSAGRHAAGQGQA
ncbi:hypothetical protein [uncultured Friedmanniella sp.]|uniref:hypothetical protein n=1 Tax=uncultured Friedmanniella sp. TaxID=335381 RepID=UPI0035CA07A9